MVALKVLLCILLDNRMHMLTRPVVTPLPMIHVHIPIHPMHLTARAIMRHTTLTGMIPSLKDGR